MVLAVKILDKTNVTDTNACSKNSVSSFAPHANPLYIISMFIISAENAFKTFDK